MALLAQRLSFRYPAQGSPAVQDVSLRLEPGELVVLLGANGSGKSTLVRLLAGLFLPDEGAVFVDGLPTPLPQHRTALRRKVGMVFQHPENQIVAQTVADEVAFGLENVNLEPSLIQQRVHQTLERVGLSAHADRSPDALSGGQLQRLALAGALAVEPSYLLVDEPFAWLDLEAQAALLEQLKATCRAGCAVVIVTQETDLLSHADRVWLMHQGHLVADAPPQTLAQAPQAFERAGLQAPPVWALCHRLRAHLPCPDPVLDLEQALRWLAPHLPAPAARIQQQEVPSVAKPLLALEDVGFSYARLPESEWLLRGVNLTLEPGSWLVLSGPSGCGKSSLVQLFNGLLRPHCGRIELQGRSIQGQRTAQLCRQVGLVFQNPRQQFFAASAYEEMAFALLEQGVSHEQIDARVQRVCRQLGLSVDLLQRPPQSLSGGEQVKVALGSVLLLEAQLLVLDETLASLDPWSRTQVLRALEQLNRNGLSLITVTHRPAALLPWAERLAWLEGGRLQLYERDCVPARVLPELALLSQALLGRRLYELEDVYLELANRLDSSSPAPR